MRPGIRVVEMSTDRWLSYADAAALLGMTPESVRQRARREHWRKQLGNEGKALVLVPIDAARNLAGDTGGDAGATPPVPRPVKHPEPDPVASAYNARIKDLEARATELREDLDKERQERDRERDERLAERERAEKIAAELADLSRRFVTSMDDARAREMMLEARLAASTDDARTRETALQAKLDAVREEMTAVQRRPWWRRLAG